MIPKRLTTKWSAAVVFSVLLLSVSSVTAQDAPRWKLKADDSLKYTLEQKTGLQMDFFGQQIKMTIAMTLDTVWAVKSVDDDGNAKVGQTIKRVQVKMIGGPLGAVSFDSDAKEQDGGNPLGQLLSGTFGSFVNQENTLTLSPRGEISDFKLSEKAQALLENPQAGLPGGLSAGGLPELLQQVIVSFPKGDLTKGKTWKNDYETAQQFGTIMASQQFTYQGVEEKGDKKGLDKITVVTKSKFKPNPDNPAKVEITSQEGQGTIYFDRKAGRLVESTTEEKMAMQVDIGGNVSKQTIATKKTVKPTAAKSEADKKKSSEKKQDE